MRALVGLKISDPRALALRYSVRYGNVIYCLHGYEVSLIKANRALKSACRVQLPLKLGILDISTRVDSCTGQ